MYRISLLFSSLRFSIADSYYAEIDGIGLVRFHHSKRARRIILSVSPSTGVKVAVPAKTPFKKAAEFVCLKRGWIQKHLAIIEQIENRKKRADVQPQTINKSEAGKKLIERLNYLAVKHGFSFNKVTIRDQKTRWGSCSSKNNISLNMKLVQLSEELMDYVILHELVHTRVHSHSNKFWAELDKYVENSKAVAKRLRTDGMMVL